MNFLPVTLFSILSICNIAEGFHISEKLVQFIDLFQNSQSNDDLSKITVDFSLEYLRYAPEQQGNMVFSPIGVVSCLGMAYAGASGLTKRQIRLYAFEDIDDARIYNDIRSTVARLKEGHRRFYLYNTLNTLVVPKSAQVSSAYHRRIEYQFNADLLKLQFDRLLLVQEINQYAKRKSWGHIKKLLNFSSEMVPEFDSLLFMNIVNFQGNWLSPFDLRETRKMPFKNEHGKVEDVEMMSKIGSHFYYANFNRIRSLGIPYAGNRLVLYIFLPPEDQSIKSLEKLLNFDIITKLIGKSVKKRMRVTIPKLELNQTVDLEHTLKYMGMRKMFSDEADFSLVTEHKRLHASSVIHGTFFHVNEKGHPMVQYKSGYGQNHEAENAYEHITVNRPFLFAVVDKPSKLIVLFGRVTDLS